MAKSLRSKREKRLRTLRRELSEPFYDKKDAAKLAAQEAALASPKLPVRAHATTMADVKMANGGANAHHQSKSLLKASGGIGKKKLEKKLNLKGRKRGKGKGSKRKIRNAGASTGVENTESSRRPIQVSSLFEVVSSDLKRLNENLKSVSKQL